MSITNTTMYIISLSVIVAIIFIKARVRNYNGHGYQIHRYQPRIPLTATEIIHTNLSIFPETVINLILIDFCGYQHMPKLQKVISLKNKFKYTAHIHCNQTLVHIAMFILLASLLFAAYCGIIFVVQNDQYLDKYSIRVQLDCGILIDENNICIVLNNGDGGGRYTYLKYAIVPEFNKYQNFYSNTFIPYLNKLNNATLLDYFQNNQPLYVSLETQKFDSFSREPVYISSTNNYYIPTIVDAYLYLNDNTFSDCDFTLAKFVKGNDKRCYSCSCFTKGGGYGCAGCDCYCEGAVTHSEHGPVNTNDCCWCCCCNYCVPCHCACGSCCLCWTGVAISVLLLLICFSMHKWIGYAILMESQIITDLEEIVKEIESIDNQWNV
eukprot:417172_1